MEATRHHEWEEDEPVVKAYSVGRAVYYVVQGEDGGYRLQYWPNENKRVETVSVLESFDTEDEAVDALEEKVS